MRFLIVIVLLLAAGFTSAGKPEQSFFIFAGSARGTYYAFAEDIRRACPSLNITIVATDGSIDNIGRLVRKNTQPAFNRFGFTQLDAFVGLGANDERVRSLTTVMQMYNEDVSLLVSLGSNIRSLSDLNGKRVAIGQPASGIWYSANYIRNLLGVNWIAVEQGNDEALLSLLVGDVDAIFLVTGHPSRILNDLPKSIERRVGLINLSELVGKSHFSLSVLPSKTYPWQSSSVELVAVRSLLLAAGDVSPAATKALTTCIKQAEPELKKWGHPKWSEINLPR